MFTFVNKEQPWNCGVFYLLPLYGVSSSLPLSQCPLNTTDGDVWYYCSL